MAKALKNYWKRYVAWVTELRDDPFVNARIKLTLIYTSALLVIFAVTPILVAVSPELSPSIYRWAFGLYVILGLATIVVSFTIGGRTLDPIRHILRTQKRFIADASHELRTPLAIMKTNSEVALMDGDRLEAREATATLKSNLEEVDRMSKIIENLLSLSYYDNRFAEIPFSPINLSELISHITEKARSLAVKKDIDLRLLNTDPGMIMGNPIALEQMAINLIKNAVTYTEKGGMVSVSVSTLDHQLEFKVKDTGIGIADKDLPHVFSPFYKAGSARIQLERESSGLGLTIVKRIIERHHGTIYINSKVGKGTTISVSFPKVIPGQTA